MQRLFTMFPVGAAGVGLLVLRIACASGILTLASSREVFASANWAVVGLGLLALALVAGALTPIACAVGASVEASYLLNSHGVDPRSVVFVLLVTVALGLLGPGAFSIDAKLFARRLIVSDLD